MEDKGLRFNTGKSRHDLVPQFAQEQYALVLTKGSEKYAERNWELGMKWSKVLASLKAILNPVPAGFALKGVVKAVNVCPDLL